MDAIDLLRELVAIDSVNPSLAAGGAGETAIASWLAEYLRRAGFDVVEEEVAPGRPNVIAVAEGRAAGPARMLCGHTDTVGVEGMTAPFAPEVRDGRLYGRGAQDMKGGLAAMIAAAQQWLGGPRSGAGRVILALVADEEYASVGAEAVAGTLGADAAVVPEPTNLAIAVAHKGFSCVDVVTYGRAAHGSRPEEGRDAVLHMGRVLARLEALDRALRGRPAHSRLGHASLHAGRISGGTELSVYPARCALQVERRTLPGEPLDVAVHELRAILDAIARDDPAFSAETQLLLARPPYEIDAGAPLPKAMARAAAAEGLEPTFSGTSFWTDAALLGAAGVPAVLFGPAGAGLHSSEEYVEIESVRRCQAVLARWLGDRD